MKKPLVVSVISLLVLHSVLGVERCYVCLDQCEELQIHECKDDGFSHDIEVKCFSIEIRSGENSLTEKGCLPADVADVECGKANQDSGTTCSVCDIDLCNGRGSAVTSFLSSVLLLVTCIIWKLL